MTRGKLILFFLLAACQNILAQQDSIALKEVTVSDVQLRHFSTTQNVLKFNDSVLAKNPSSLTALLHYNSTVYFKENGLGMVSSPSFRGTTAQQTAVIWNGININSQTSGQTDFNTISTKDFQNISVRAGGGSAIYGSSAIGGSIHLNNDLAFGNAFSNRLDLVYGSFNTFQGSYGISVSNQKVSANVSVSHNNSDNDYDYPDSKTDRKNENGQFHNTSLNAAFGYKINAANYLKLYSQVFEGERHFSLTSPTDTKTKYRDSNARNLLEWTSFFNRFTSKVKMAFLKERYQYFENIDSGNFTFGQVETFIARYDVAYDFNQRTALNLIVDYTQHHGNGSDIVSQTRQIGSVSLLFRQRVGDFLKYEWTARKEATSNYDSPFLFSAGTELSVVKWHSLKLNFSHNFRIPTFNDLYWQGAGNPELKPESSYQGEIGNEFRLGAFRLTATVFQMQIRDMIRWIPGAGGRFAPENTNRVRVNGVEVLAHYGRTLGKHRIGLDATYAYNDSRNSETEKFLIYVPFHKATGNLGYGYGKFSLNWQQLYNGFAFTQSDNNPLKKVRMYHVSNVMADYDFGKKDSYRLGLRTLNLWNEKYESVSGYPMPGRHFNVYLILNF